MYEDFNIFLLKLPEDCKEITTAQCVQFHLPRTHHVCPACGSQHTYVHSYRAQNLCGLSTNTVYIYRKRRYRCQDCGKAFPEENPFIDHFQRIPNSEINNIIKEHGELVPASLIARRHGISANTVMRHFARGVNGVEEKDAPTEKTLSTVISIDEFRGNAGAKFQVVVNDLQHRKCCDIIDDRSVATLYDHVRNYPLADRESVALVSIDLSPLFRRLVEDFLPNAEIVADKFHAVRLANDALDSIRKEVQTGLDKHNRKWFKNSRRVLLRRQHKLSSGERAKLSQMFSLSEKLILAHALKEEYYRLFDSCDRKTFKERLRNFREHVLAANIAPFIRVLKTTEQWKEEIWNGIRTGYNNGFTEGCNNTIKVLKRVCYGFRSFANFRRRIMYILNSEVRQSRRTKKS